MVFRYSNLNQFSKRKKTEDLSKEIFSQLEAFWNIRLVCKVCKQRRNKKNSYLKNHDVLFSL